MEIADVLALQWQAAKQREEQARADRIRVEEKILGLYPAKDEGSTTVLTPLGHKIRTTGKWSYKCDLQLLQTLTIDWPEDVRPVRMKLEADETRLKMIRCESPVMWAKIAQAVTTKPAKTGVSIEIKGETHGL